MRTATLRLGLVPQPLSGARRRTALLAALALACVATPLLLAQGAAALPTWSDATEDAGLAFRLAGDIYREPTGHELPDTHWPGFPEIMGGGACWADVDNDGYEDVYVVNQDYNAGNPAWGDWALDLDTRNRLFLNDGDGTFTDATDGSGADADVFGYGCSAADYDADGCLDLFSANFGPSYLYRGRCDGTFTNATAALGPVGEDDACGEDYRCMSTSSGWFDYNRDGFLDLYVDNYVETFLTDQERGPLFHISQLNFLLRNNGDGTFTELAESVGAAGYYADTEGSKSLGVAFFDYDHNGWTDVYVANDESPNNLFRNNGDGTFTEVAFEAGVRDTRAGMGVSAGDYDNDGWADLFFTHYETETNGFYRNLHDGTFEDRSGEDEQVNSTDRVGWGTRLADLDRDGWLDIILANGHTEWFLDGTYPLDLQVYMNQPEAAPSGPGDRYWADASEATGLGSVGTNKVFRGLAVADMDLDGDLDFIGIPNANDTAVVFEGSNVTNHWLYLQLREPGNNRDALGATVKVTAGGLAQVRDNFPGQSYLSQHSMLLDVGLGSATEADVHITWTNGATTTLTGVPADRVVRVTRGVPGYVTDTLAPRTSAALEGPGQQGWWRGDVAATVTAAERAVGPASGVVLTETSLDDGPWIPYGAPVAIAGEGIHELRVRSLDAVGNQEPRRLTRVPIDLTPPTPAHEVSGVAGFDGWFLTQPTVSLAAPDAFSGPGAIRYRVDGGAWQAYAEPFGLSEGIHEVAFVAADVAGNEASEVVFEVRVDTSAPQVAFAAPAPGSLHVASAPAVQLPTGPAVVVADRTARFRVLAPATDATSGVLVVRIALDGATIAVDGAAPYEASWDTSRTAEGLHLLEAFATDAAGNAQHAEVRIVLVSAAIGSVDATLRPLGVELPAPPEPPPLPAALPLALLVGAPLVVRRRP